MMDKQLSNPRNTKRNTTPKKVKSSSSKRKEKPRIGKSFIRRLSMIMSELIEPSSQSLRKEIC